MIGLIRCGYNIIHENDFTIDRQYGSNDYLFLLFRSRMKIGIDGRIVEADKDTCIIYRKGSKQYYRGAEHPMVHDWFHFDGDDVTAYLERLQLPFDTPLKVHEPFYVSKKIGEIQEALVVGGHYRDEIIDATIRCLLMRLSDMKHRINSRNPISKHYDQFVALRDEIIRHPSVFYTVEELAERMNMSRSYFQRLYKELFGISVVGDIIRNRLEHAMYLLSNTTYGVSDVAELCGYANDVHFMRQFKKFVGLTPSEYRSTKSVLMNHNS